MRPKTIRLLEIIPYRTEERGGSCLPVVAPMDEGTIWYLCTVAPLLYLLSDLLTPPPLPNVQYLQTVCDCGGGGGGC